MKTKIYLTAAAVATLTLGSCSQDQVVEQSFDAQPKAIEFGVYSGKAAESRGLITDAADAPSTTSNTIKTTGFGINAVYTGQVKWSSAASKVPNFMYNQTVDYNQTVSSDWGYSPVKYWPTTQGDMISFFAYAPYSKTTNSGSDYGITLKGNNVAANQLDFTVNNKASDMVDFVAANRIDVTATTAKDEETNYTDGNNPKTVDFNMKHELTRLNFTATVSEDLETNVSYVVVKSAQFDANATSGQIYDKATYTFSDTEGNAGTWTIPSTPTYLGDYDLSSVLCTSTVSFSGATAGTAYSSSPTAPTKAVTGITVTTDGAGDGDNKTNLFTDNQYLFFIPVANGLTENVNTVTFTYDIVTLDTKLADGYSCTSATKTVALPKGIMQQGKAYNVNFKFCVDQIKVSATVANWENGTDPADTNVQWSDTK